GFEVIYSGLHRAPEEIVQAAVQEDVDVVGISILSGAHNTLLPEVLEALEERNAGDIGVFAGGIIPENDADQLREQGIERVFTPGTSTGEIVDFVRQICASRHNDET
ncbi:MAG: cobalamin-dependent protein, partial [Bradymonadaceae bacterium]